MKRLIRRLVSFHFARLPGETARAERGVGWALLGFQISQSNVGEVVDKRSISEELGFEIRDNVAESWVDVEDSGGCNST